jgi:cytidyltransferase-like protein
VRSRLLAFLFISLLCALPIAHAENAAYIGPLREHYWCLAHFMEKEPLCGAACDFEPLLDIDNPDQIRARLPVAKISKSATAAERIAILKGFPIEEITAAPGHIYLRNPKQLAGLKQYISSSKGGDFAHDPLLFNFVTAHDGTLITIDLWNAHHRLVAYLESGYHFMDEIPPANLKILVNGRTTEGAAWPHYLSVAGIDETANIKTWTVPAGGDIRVGTVAVDGKNDNFKLGSRTTIGKLRENMLYRKHPKIGVYFGSFDPPHAGHLEVAKEALAALGLDEIVIVPNATVAGKPGLTSLEKRLPLLRAFVKGEPRINL